MIIARGEGYPDYSAFPEHKVVNISAAPNKKVVTVSPDGQQIVHQVSLMAVLIGTRPDLSFLTPEYSNGQALAVSIIYYLLIMTKFVFTIVNLFLRVNGLF